MENTFNISLKTPMGTKKGQLYFVDQNGVLNGYILTMGNKSPFRNGKMIGNHFEFSGTLNAGFFNFKYSAKGSIDGDSLNGIANTGSGTFQIHGSRMI